MTVINSDTLLRAAPIKDMLTHKVKANGVSHGLTEAGYDIRIKQDIMFSSASGSPRVTALAHAGGDFVANKAGRFILASAMEEFNMPPTLLGIVHDKSTWARKGLSVFNTVIEPGWKGFLTLELVYHGDEELHIPAGSGIAQVIFHDLHLAANYDGKYQNQADKPVAAIYQD